MAKLYKNPNKGNVKLQCKSVAVNSSELLQKGLEKETERKIKRLNKQLREISSKFKVIALTEDPKICRVVCQVCGTEEDRNVARIVAGLPLSCSKHKGIKIHTHITPLQKLYRVYYTMRTRCYNENAGDFKYWGKRGIVMCDEWLSSRQSFFEWALSNGYKDGYEFHRIDNNGNYEPGNVRIISKEEHQLLTYPNAPRFTYNGRTQLIRSWCKQLGLKYRDAVKDVNIIVEAIKAKEVNGEKR